MAVNKKSILDKVASVDTKTKKKIKEQENSEENNVVERSIGRQIDDEILNFKINDDDDEFLVFIKEEINKSQITKSELYQIYNRSEAYNMIYTLNQGTISLQRLKKWLKALGKELVLTTIDIKE